MPLHVCPRQHRKWTDGGRLPPDVFLSVVVLASGLPEGSGFPVPPTWWWFHPHVSMCFRVHVFPCPRVSVVELTCDLRPHEGLCIRHPSPIIWFSECTLVAILYVCMHVYPLGAPWGGEFYFPPCWTSSQRSGTAGETKQE